MNKRGLFFALFVAALLVVTPAIAPAQFVNGKSALGPCIGLSFLGSTPQFGVNYEYGIDVQNFGLLGIGGIFRYWSYSEDYYSGKWKYTDILIGAQGNYHFKVGDRKFDPYLGLTLAYDAGSVSWEGAYSTYATPTHGGLFLGADAGARYWISPTVALTGRLGFGSLGYGALDLGVDFKF